jgi:3',5'-cyclic AMP phosphodiesterase CpdA
MLQVSDPHFGTQRPPVVRALLRLAADLAPDVLLLSGDITQRARRKQFEQARRFVDVVRARTVVAVPGNHDIPLYNVFARILRPYGNYVRCFGAELEPVLDLPDVLVVAVNTTRPHRHKHGEVSPAQVERVASRLRRAAAAQVRVVVVHQPILAIRPRDAINVLRGAEHAAMAWAEAGADLVVGGHIHLPYVRSLRDSYPGLARDVFTAQAGTALSTRIRDGVPNSVNVLRCNRDELARGCTVERWDFAERDGQFQLNARHDLRFVS